MPLPLHLPLSPGGESLAEYLAARFRYQPEACSVVDKSRNFAGQLPRFELQLLAQNKWVELSSVQSELNKTAAHYSLEPCSWAMSSSERYKTSLVETVRSQAQCFAARYNLGVVHIAGLLLGLRAMALDMLGPDKPAQTALDAHYLFPKLVSFSWAQKATLWSVLQRRPR